MNWRIIAAITLGLSCFFNHNVLFSAGIQSTNPKPPSLYRWVKNAQEEALRVKQGEERLQHAIANPEYMLEHWVDLPSSPETQHKRAEHLTLREAILLALRYNTNIQNAELDRIVQRYQLRLAHNEFELQYALAAQAAVEKNRYSGVGSAATQSYIATPEVNLKTKMGTQIGLNLQNNVPGYNSYMPVLNLSLSQPLLRGFGKTANETALLNALDNEQLNELNVQQSVMDQITQVILAYRALILSGNYFKTQQRQLEEARQTFKTNEKKIEAGQLEPTGNIQQSYQIESLKLMVEQAENDFKTAAQDLLQAIGLDPQMRLSVPSDIEVEQLTVPDRQRSIQLALEHNVTYLAQKMALQADERAYALVKNQRLWQLDLGANIQNGVVTDVDSNHNNNTGQRFRAIYSGQNTTESARLTLTIPLHDISQRNQFIQAKVKLEKDRLNLIATKRTLETMVTNTINMIQSQMKRYQLAKKQALLAAQSYTLEKKKQQAGIASALDVNNTQNQLIQAEMGLINAKIAYLNQISILQRIIGITLAHWRIKLRYAG